MLVGQWNCFLILSITLIHPVVLFVPGVGLDVVEMKQSTGEYTSHSNSSSPWDFSCPPPRPYLLSAKLLDSSLPFLIPLSHQSFQTPPMPFFSGLPQWLLQVPQWLPHESCSGQVFVLVWTPQAAMTMCWLLLSFGVQSATLAGFSS